MLKIGEQGASVRINRCRNDQGEGAYTHWIDSTKPEGARATLATANAFDAAADPKAHPAIAGEEIAHHI